jgi:membrane protein CcdC involved in cytochrome C biogenesis
VTNVSAAASGASKDLIFVRMSSSPAVIPYASLNAIIPSFQFVTSPTFPYSQGVTGYFTISSASVLTAMQLGIVLEGAGPSNTCDYRMQVSNIYIQQVA